MAGQPIGSATVTDRGTVFYAVRAETDPDDELQVVGDLFDEVPIEDFLDLGWALKGRLQNPGDRAEILAVE